MSDTTSAPDTSWVPNEPDRASFAYRVRLLRTDMGLTLKEAGELCGFPHTTWTSWEQGHSPRNMAEVVERIHLATAVNRSWLMWGSTSARLSHDHLVGLPSIRDGRSSSRTDSPIMTLVPPSQDD